MEKTFVLDTNVILFDPTAIFKFGSNKVSIPLVVVEEIDRFKKDQNENGRNARHFSRIIDDLRKKGSLAEGVELDNGGTLYLSVGAPEVFEDQKFIDLNVNDNVILNSAVKLDKAGENVLLVTKDINLGKREDAVN